MIEDLIKIVKNLPGVTFDIKWENHLCFNVGGKIFLITSPDEVPVSASFKVPDEEFDEWTTRSGIIPAPYLARYKWVRIDDITKLNLKEWEEVLLYAYRHKSKSLTARRRKELGIENG